MTGQEIIELHKTKYKHLPLSVIIDMEIDKIRLEEYTRGYNAGMEFAERLAPLMQERRENADQAHN